MFDIFKNIDKETIEELQNHIIILQEAHLESQKNISTVLENHKEVISELEEGLMKIIEVNNSLTLQVQSLSKDLLEITAVSRQMLEVLHQKGILEETFPLFTRLH